MKNVIAIGVATVLGCMTGTALAQVVDEGGPGPEGQQYVVPSQRIESVPVPSNRPSLNVTTPSGSVAHIFPSVQMRARMPAAGGADPGPLLYHDSGLIMHRLKIYEIFWSPDTLQTGDSTGFSPNYFEVQTKFGDLYNGHGIGNNNTQYFQTINGKTTYVRNQGDLAGVVVDTSPYPVSGCNDAFTPGNCITDAQIRTEILKVIRQEQWKVGLDSIFLLYTSSGEGSCFDQSGNTCAYSSYCAYHSFISPSSGKREDTVIYGNEPYGNTAFCQIPGVPSPNNDPDADTASTATSHEVTEAATDPLLDAWFTAQGNEIGDLCAYNYGLNTWDGGLANQQWSGHFFELQTEFNNHVSACTQIGPNLN